MRQRQPDENVIQMIVFGEVRGYGESVLIHLGNRSWIIIDSCLNENSEPAAISYLESIDVDVSQDVKLIVASHWHDDHIKGLSKTLSKCVSANFAMPRVFTQKNFLHFLTINKNNSSKESRINPDSSEILKCLNKLDKSSLRLASEDNLLWMKGGANFSHEKTVEVFSLSPSEYQFNEFISKIELYSKNSNNWNGMILKKKEIFDNENELAVAILIKIGECSILLGSDVVEGNSNFGWKKIVNNWKDRDVKSWIYKVAHHGSKDADCKEIWGDLLIDNPISIVTPYSQGRSPSPTEDSIKNLKLRSKEVYITSQFHVDKIIRANKNNSEHKVNTTSTKVDDFFQCGAVNVIFDVLGDKIEVKSHNGACKL